jgi:HSP20 family molecular chaperone IbpA
MTLLNSLIPAFGRSPVRREAPARTGAPGVRPAYDIRETDEAWGLTVHLPGVAKAGLSITDEDGTLTIRGERAWAQPAGWTSLYRETRDLPFELRLQHDNGFDADKVRAELKDGVLRLSLPKTEARKPRRIEVS